MMVDLLTCGLENFLNQSIQLDDHDDDNDRPPAQMDYGIIETRKE